LEAGRTPAVPADGQLLESALRAVLINVRAKAGVDSADPQGGWPDTTPPSLTR
jgi:hypothetical protein